MMQTIRSRAALVCVVVMSGALLGPATHAVVAQSAAPGTVAIWPADAVAVAGIKDPDRPSVTPFLPAADKRTGAALLVVPSVTSATRGGATTGATDVASWLRDQGIAAFVLRPRATVTSPRADVVGDVARAIQYIRANAPELQVSASRVGAIGLGSGAALLVDALHAPAGVGSSASSDSVARESSRPALMALVHGFAPLSENAPAPPPTFLVGSTRTDDNEGGMVDLWEQLRVLRTPVDAHFVSRPGGAAWRSSFLSWVTYRGFLTDEPRLPMRGMLLLDGRPIPHGYVVFTPLDAVGAGPVVGRVMNSTANVPIGQFTVPEAQGPTPGRYRVEVHQNASRWLSNSFTPGLTREPAFGHSRILSPSLDDHRVYTRVRPTDSADYIVNLQPGETDAVRIEVWSATPPVERTPPRIAGLPAPDVANPGVAAYYEQLKFTPDPVPGVPEPVLLWPDGAPGAVPDENGVFTDEDKPALYVYRPATGLNTGTAMLVLPGGAFTNRAIDQEGVQIARSLNRQGIAAFVLRYRIRPNYNGQVSTADAHRAMRHIRANAPSYRVAPNRIGVIGFSAGAELEGDAFFNSLLAGDPSATDPLDRVSTTSNFNVLIYGGRNVRTPEAAAPTFMFVTLEDGGNHLAPQINVLNGLRAAGVPVEAHWYQDGPHGTSLSPGDPQLGQWPGLMVDWLRRERLMPPTP